MAISLGIYPTFSDKPMSSGEIHLELCQGDLPIAICIYQLGQGAASLLSLPSMGVSEHWSRKFHRFGRHQSYEKCWENSHVEGFLWVFEVYSFQMHFRSDTSSQHPTTAPILASARVSAASVSSAAQLLSWRGPGEACSLPGINTPHLSHAVWWVLSIWVCCLMNVVHKVRRINIKWWSIV